MNLTTAGIRCGIPQRLSKYVLFSAVTPSHTFRYPSPQSAGSIFRMFYGRFVRINQSCRRHRRISANKSWRHCGGTWLSKTSASDAQKTRGRRPCSRLNARASAFHFNGFFQFSSETRKQSLSLGQSLAGRRSSVAPA